jgi:hypothetical protein
MRKAVNGKILYLTVSTLLVFGAWHAGQLSVESQMASSGDPATTQKSLMHVFVYTPLEGATQADFDAFKKSTADMVAAIPGFRKVWVGKLRRPLTIYTPADGEHDQGDSERVYGVAMEFDDEAALDVYANHPAHTDWIEAYDRVRVPGTTTVDILGE